MREAARALDPITHTSALAGLIGDLVVGAIVGAAIVATGGAAVAAIAVAAAGGASLGASAGQLLGSLFTFKTGAISLPCSTTVIIGRKNAARALADMGDCSGIPFSPTPPHPRMPIAEGSKTVFVQRFPAARKDDKLTCSAVISEGCLTVIIGGGKTQYAKISAEVPFWLEMGVLALGLVSGAAAISLAGRGMRVITALRLTGGLAGSFGLGAGGTWLGGKIWGQGSAGQKLLGFGMGFFGGYLGARLAGSGPIYGRVQQWAAKRNFPGLQTGNACGVQSCQQVIRAVKGRNLSQAEMEQIGINRGVYNPATGTKAGVGEADILASQGIPARAHPSTPQAIRKALSEGKGVIASHDPGALWNTGQTGGHAVLTTGVVRNSSGRVTHYIINDTGTGQAGRLVPAGQYEASLNPGKTVAITDDPIW